MVRGSVACVNGPREGPGPAAGAALGRLSWLLQANINRALDSWPGPDQTVYNSWPGAAELTVL